MPLQLLDAEAGSEETSRGSKTSVHPLPGTYHAVSPDYISSFYVQGFFLYYDGSGLPQGPCLANNLFPLKVGLRWVSCQ